MKQPKGCKQLKMTNKKKVDWKVLCTGLVCITVIELYALSIGINGMLLTTMVALIAAIVGINIPRPTILK